MLMNDKLANKFFNEYKARLTTRIGAVLAAGSITADGGSIVSPLLDRYLRYLIAEPNLENFITASPYELKNIIEQYYDLYPSFFDTTHDDYKILKNIFISHVYENIDKIRFITNIGVDTCVYCNRCYTTALDEVGSIKPQIDHFYPKGIFPFLGASYYNLIPSCLTCNGIGAKHQMDSYQVGLVSPYLMNHSQFKFSYHVKASNITLASAKSTVDIYFTKKIHANDEAFKLEALYKEHADHVVELIVKSRYRYSKKYREYLNAYKGVKFTQKEIDRLIIGNYVEEKDFHKRPLSKLYHDIGKELGLISL